MYYKYNSTKKIISIIITIMKVLLILGILEKC